MRSERDGAGGVLLCRAGVREALFGNEQVSVVDRTTQLKHGGPCSSHWTIAVSGFDTPIS